jgi:hypothetical protein
VDTTKLPTFQAVVESADFSTVG